MGEFPVDRRLRFIAEKEEREREKKEDDAHQANKAAANQVLCNGIRHVLESMQRRYP